MSIWHIILFIVFVIISAFFAKVMDSGIKMDKPDKMFFIVLASIGLFISVGCVLSNYSTYVKTKSHPDLTFLEIVMLNFP